MKKSLKSASGVITVMVSLLLIPLLSFGTLIMEAGRYVSAKQVLADAQITASMSILANYNTYLYERFGILAIDPDETAEKTKESFVADLKYNSDNVDGVSSSSKLYNLNSEVTFETIYNLSDYTVLKRQVLEYAKYSVPYTVISNKLDIDSLFSKLTSKITDNKVFNFIENILASTESSVNAMDLAFTALGRVEYRTLDFLNFLSEDSNKEYTKDAYKSEDLYKEYIKKDGEIDKGDLQKYNESDRYVSGREGYINAIQEKTNFMANNPDPSKSLEDAKEISASTTSVGYSNLYKAAIQKFLKTDSNKPTDDDEDGADIYYTLAKKTSVSFTVDTGCSYGYDLSAGTAYVYETSGTDTVTVKIVEAVRKISGDTDATVSCYADLEEFADVYNISLTTDYIGYYEDDLAQNAKATAKANLITELTQKKNEYDSEINRLNGVIDTEKTVYLEDLSTAKDKLNEIAKSIEDKSTKIKELVTNDDGELVEGTANTKYYEGAKGRLQYAQETYEKTTDEVENSESKSLGSNSSKVKVNIDSVVSDLGTRLNKANDAISHINELITNISNTSSSSIKSYSHSDGADIVNGSTRIGSACSVLAGYVSSDFSVIEEFVNTPVVDAEEDKNFSLESVGDTLGISDIWNSFKKIKEILNVVPAVYDDSYIVTLEDAAYDLLPAMTEDSTYNKSDEEYVYQMFDEVEKTLGDVFSGTVLGDNIKDQDMSAFQSTTSSLFGDASSESTENSTASDIFGAADSNKSSGILKLVTKIKEIINKIKEAFTALKDLFGHFKTLISNFVKETYYTILINTYIIQKFPSRMNTVEEATTYPTGSESGSYFSGCCVEYCIFGNKSEKTNQASAFWLIFGIKAIVNCVQILTDSEAMSLISSCNIFAPLMFIAMLYMETNIDMNYLLRLGEKVPIWKENLHLSAEGIAKIADEILDFDNTKVYVTTSGNGKKYHKKDCMTIKTTENKTVEVISKSVKDAINAGFTACKVCNPTTSADDDSEDSSDGILPLSYDNYLYVLMLFISTNTKLKNLANLIQLETRYYEAKQGVTSNFRIDKASTYVRSEVVASYDTMLPMFSLGSGSGFAEIGGVEYVGY